MQEYQTIKIKETHEEMIVGTTEYPFTLAGVFYIKFIVYRHDTLNDVYIPKKFVTLQPQDVLTRENLWTQEEEDRIVEGSNAALEQAKTMAEYRKAAEEEMKRRATENPPQPKPVDDDSDIDPDFSTQADPNDYMWG